MAAATCSACGQLYPEGDLNKEGKCRHCRRRREEAAPPAESFPDDEAKAAGATTPATESTA